MFLSRLQFSFYYANTTLESLRGYLVIALGIPDDEFKGFGLLRELSNELGPWKNISENYTIADLEHNIMDIDHLHARAFAYFEFSILSLGSVTSIPRKD